MKKLTSLALVMAMLLCIFSSCADNPPAQSTNALPQSSAEEPAADLVIDSKTEFTIVYPREASGTLKESANTLFNAFLTRLTVRTGTGDDSKTTGNEIHIGSTKEVSQEDLAGLKLNDYRIFARNGKLYFVGGSDEAVQSAVKKYIDTYIKRGEKSLTVPGNFQEEFHDEYPLAESKLNGKLLSEYTVTVPANCDLFTLYAARNLIDFVKINMGISLSLDQSGNASAPAILVGGESKIEYRDNQYSLHSENGTILLNGKDYMIGGAVGELINRYLKTEADEAMPTEAQAKDFAFLETKNAVLLIGDGMGKNHINAALKDKLSSFHAHSIPYRTDCITFSQSVTNGDAEYTDSAAAATALATGFKTLNGFLGMDADQKNLTNAREFASACGAKTAILSTDEITGATPSGFLAHVNERTATSAIQKQIDALLEEGKVDFAEGSLDYKLRERSAIALHSISAGDSRFFAMIEEGIIDKHSHNNLYDSMLNTMERFDDLIAYTMEFVLCHPDTALIVTADHETGGLTLNETEGSFHFTSSNHTNADVDLFMMGYDAEELTSKPLDNTQIGQYLCDLYR